MTGDSQSPSSSHGEGYMPVFGKQPKRTLHTIIRELVERTNTDTGRIRILEQEGDIFKSRVNTLEQDMLNQRKQIQASLSGFESRIAKQEEMLSKLEKTIKEVIKEIKKLATVAKIKELEHLIDIYSPIKSSFITREEAERMVEEKLAEKAE